MIWKKEGWNKMKKFPLLAAAIMTVAVLSAPAAMAVPSPTEPDRSSTEVGEPDTPSSFVPAPQTDGTGLDGVEILALAAAASAVCGAVTLVKAKRQSGPERRDEIPR